MTAKSLFKSTKPSGGYWDYGCEKQDRRAPLKVEANKEIQQGIGNPIGRTAKEEQPSSIMWRDSYERIKKSGNEGLNRSLGMVAPLVAQKDFYQFMILSYSDKMKYLDDDFSVMDKDDTQ